MCVHVPVFCEQSYEDEELLLLIANLAIIGLNFTVC